MISVVDNLVKEGYNCLEAICFIFMLENLILKFHQKKYEISKETKKNSLIKKNICRREKVEIKKAKMKKTCWTNKKHQFFLIKKIKWEISPQQHKRSLDKKRKSKKVSKQQPQRQQQQQQQKEVRTKRSYDPKEVRIKIQIWRFTSIRYTKFNV